MTETVTPTTIRYSADRAVLEPPVEDSQIRLTAGGAGFMGTFTKMAAALVNDILDDGEPIMATLVTEDETDHEFVQLDGLIVKYEKRLVTFEDGTTVLDSFLLSVTI